MGLKMKKWVRREAISQARLPAEVRDEVYLHRVEEELKEFAGRSFR